MIFEEKSGEEPKKGADAAAQESGDVEGAFLKNTSHKVSKVSPLKNNGGEEGQGEAQKEGSQDDEASLKAFEEAEKGREVLRQELSVLKEQNMRLQAEIDNIQKRRVRERQETAQFSTTELLRNLLPVADNMMRAFQMAEGMKKSEGGRVFEGFLSGFRLVEKEFLDFLKKQGVTQVKSYKEPFNPHQHEAMRYEPSQDHPPQTVISVMQEGYELHNRLLRPALVVVSCEKDDEEGAEKKIK